MNVPSATPPVAGSAVSGAISAGAGVTAAVTSGRGIADLFSALLASLQAPLVNTPVVSISDGPAEGKSTGSTTAPIVDGKDSDAFPTAVSAVEIPRKSAGEDSGVDATSADAASAPLEVPLVGVPAVVVNSAPDALQTVGETVGNGDGVEAKSVPAQPVTQAAPRKPASEVVVGITPAPLEAETDSASAPVTAEPEAELEPILPPKAGQSAPPLVPSDQGVFVTEAVRQGQLPAAQVETGSDRTLRRLIQDAIESARARAESAELVSDTEGDALVSNEPAVDDGTDAPVFAKRAGLEVIPELRPGLSSGSGATPTAQPAAAGIAAGLASGDAPASAEVTPEARESARGALPQSVDVRNVGDFTVRSVRYLSSRGDETVTVRLVPQSLGELHLAVRSASDGLEIVLTAANHVARERLEGQIVGLRDALLREGVDVSRVTVQAPPNFDLGSQMPSQHQHHQQHAGQSARQHAPTYREPEQNPPEQQFARSGRPQHDGGLNMLA